MHAGSWHRAWLVPVSRIHISPVSGAAPMFNTFTSVDFPTPFSPKPVDFPCSQRQRRVLQCHTGAVAIAGRPQIGHGRGLLNRIARHQVQRNAGPLPETPIALNASAIASGPAPAISRRVSSSRAFGPSSMPAWIRPWFSRSVSDPGKA